MKQTREKENSVIQKENIKKGHTWKNVSIKKQQINLALSVWMVLI
jgi:hypothetical protein